MQLTKSPQFQRRECTENRSADSPTAKRFSVPSETETVQFLCRVLLGGEVFGNPRVRGNKGEGKKDGRKRRGWCDIIGAGGRLLPGAHGTWMVAPAPKHSTHRFVWPEPPLVPVTWYTEQATGVVSFYTMTWDVQWYRWWSSPWWRQTGRCRTCSLGTKSTTNLHCCTVCAASLPA